MKHAKQLICLFAAIAAVTLLANASPAKKKYEHPFQNPSLSMEQRVDNLLSLLTVDEKLGLLCRQGIERLNIHAPVSTEAIHGIVQTGVDIGMETQFQLPDSIRRRMEARPKPKYTHSSSFPQGYGIGETWDRESAHTMGEMMSQEGRFYSVYGDKKSIFLWGPNVDLGRDPRWGRTEEVYGEDPFLVGELAVSETRGVQGDDKKYWRGAVLMKHFLANSNEDGRYFTNSQFDEKLFRDYYSYGFARVALKSNVKSTMMAYNAYNGIPCMAHPMITEILQNEWGMDGIIINDAGSLRQMVDGHHYAKDVNEAIKMALEAGLTNFIEGNPKMLRDAYDLGYISDELLDKRAKATLRTYLRLGLLDDDCPYDVIPEGTQPPWETEESKAAVRRITEKSVVLLKNDGLLPLDKGKVKKIAVFGNRAETLVRDLYSADFAYSVNALQGIQNAVKGQDIEVRYQKWDNDGSGQELAKWADVCIVCVGNHPLCSPDWGPRKVTAPWATGTIAGEGKEGVDRRSLQLESEDLIKVIWQANHNTVVALISGYPYAINWSQENVPAILHMAQGSQELGNALANVIFGDYNPAGRTTQTWVRDILDLPNMLDYDIRHGRTYMYFKGDPLYPFGYGLSYTRFEYSNLEVRKEKDSYSFCFDLANVGDRDGEEVVQLYAKVKDDDAAKRLRGFDRIALSKGEKKKVVITVPVEDLKLWDETRHSFELNRGACDIQIGASSADIRLHTRINL